MDFLLRVSFLFNVVLACGTPLTFLRHNSRQIQFTVFPTLAELVALRPLKDTRHQTFPQGWAPTQ